MFCIQNSCIPSILIDPESTGFSTIERYQKQVAFGSLDICNNSRYYNAGFSTIEKYLVPEVVQDKYIYYLLGCIPRSLRY